MKEILGLQFVPRCVCLEEMNPLKLCVVEICIYLYGHSDSQGSGLERRACGKQCHSCGSFLWRDGARLGTCSQAMWLGDRSHLPRPFNILFTFMWMGALPVCMSVRSMSGGFILEIDLWAAIWVLGIELGSTLEEKPVPLTAELFSVCPASLLTSCWVYWKLDYVGNRLWVYFKELGDSLGVI